MIATKIRRRAAVVATVLAVPALSSCSVSFDAQTDQYYTPTDGENAREGTVDVLHALIISDTPGSGRLIAGLANGDPEEEQTLTGVQGLEDDANVQFSLVEGDTTIPAGGLVQLADEGSPVIAVSGDPENVAAGEYVRLAFTFGNGEEVPINVPVLAPGEDYADIELPEGSSDGATGAADPTDEPTDTEG